MRDPGIARAAASRPAVPRAAPIHRGVRLVRTAAVGRSAASPSSVAPSSGAMPCAGMTGAVYPACPARRRRMPACRCIRCGRVRCRRGPSRPPHDVCRAAVSRTVFSRLPYDSPILRLPRPSSGARVPRPRRIRIRHARCIPASRAVHSFFHSTCPRWDESEATRREFRLRAKSNAAFAISPDPTYTKGVISGESDWFLSLPHQHRLTPGSCGTVEAILFPSIPDSRCPSPSASSLWTHPREIRGRSHP